jgi:uroporphyrinogen decarboxylase
MRNRQSSTAFRANHPRLFAVYQLPLPLAAIAAGALSRAGLRLTEPNRFPVSPRFSHPNNIYHHLRSLSGLVEGRRGKLWRTAGREKETPPPVWLMRQAGRYLPEYREARAKAGSFWNLCMDPVGAAAVTLQPVTRFGLDAAILFSDILVIPHALGKRVAFEEGTGPRLERSFSAGELEMDPVRWREKLSPVYEAIDGVASRLDQACDLIGFAGGPWTLAVYMAEGEASKDQRAARLWGYRDAEGFTQFLGVIADCVSEHLCAQAGAGANVLQIFDS